MQVGTIEEGYGWLQDRIGQTVTVNFGQNTLTHGIQGPLEVEVLEERDGKMILQWTSDDEFHYEVNQQGHAWKVMR